jgi:hypothetical protein
MNKQQADSQIRVWVDKANTDWKLVPVRNELCAKIIHLLVSDGFRELRHITYLHLFQQLSLAVDDDKAREIIAITDYLSSDRLKLLEMKFQFYDDNDDDSLPIEIDNSDVTSAMVDGKFYHPISGKLVDDFRRRVFAYFAPSEQLRKVHE